MLFVYLKKCITFPMRNTVRRKPEGMQQRLSRIGMVDARYNNSKLNLAYITSKTSIFSLKNERKLKSVGNLVVLSMLSKLLIFEQDTSKNRRKTKFYQTLSKCFWAYFYCIKRLKFDIFDRTLELEKKPKSRTKLFKKTSSLCPSPIMHKRNWGPTWKTWKTWPRLTKLFQNPSCAHPKHFSKKSLA